MWCTSTAVQNVAKVEVMRLRASTYPPKRQKKITVVRRFWSPVRQGGGFSYSMYTKTRTTVRTHRGRRAAPYAQGPQVFVHQQAFHVGGTLHLPGCGLHLLGCACTCTRTPSHQIVLHLFCVVPIPSLLCSPHPHPFCAVRSTRVMERLTLDELCSQLEARVFPNDLRASIRSTRVSMRYTLEERIVRLESTAEKGCDVLGAVHGTPSARLIALHGKACSSKPVSFKTHSRRVHRTR